MNKSQSLFVVLMSLLLGACASVSEGMLSTPQVKLTDVQVMGFGFKEQTFLLAFEVENPNPIALPIKSVEYNIKLDGQRFASGETASSFNVPAGGQTEFAVSVDLNLLQTSPQMLTIVRDASRRPISYELSGRFGVDVPLVPYIKYKNSGDIRMASDANQLSLSMFGK